MPTPAQVQAETPAESFRRTGLQPGDVVWVNPARLVSLRARRHEDGTHRCTWVSLTDNVHVELPPGVVLATHQPPAFWRMPITADVTNSATTPPAPSTKATVVPWFSRVAAWVHSILAAVTRAVCPVVRKISKVFMRRQPAPAAIPPQREITAALRAELEAWLPQLARATATAVQDAARRNPPPPPEAAP